MTQENQTILIRIGSALIVLALTVVGFTVFKDNPGAQQAVFATSALIAGWVGLKRPGDVTVQARSELPTLPGT